MNDASSEAVAGASPRPQGHTPVASGRIGVLIANLGTPDATDYCSMRRYLKEFLSDKRVIEENSLTWKFVFNFIILTLRPRAKGRDYDSIWNRERDESPLKTITRSQSEKLSASLASLDSRILVGWGMRYGNPSVGSAIEALRAKRMRPYSLYAALSAICRRHHGDCLRCRVRAACGHALSADAAGHTAVL